MPRSALSGTRIRALRTARRLGQADLARLAGISASYLNLIEHNRRRVGPTLMATLARALQVAPSALDDSAGDALVEGLLDAAARSAGAGPEPETDRADEFSGRFPGWATLVARMQARLDQQDQTIQRLTDRFAHDPNLSAALHEIVSAVTAVQSTAAILAESEDLASEWRARFHANIHRDSARLANSAEALVAYLDTTVEPSALASPAEELDSWLARIDYHLPEIEPAPRRRPSIDVTALIAAQPELASAAARRLAEDWLRRAEADAQALPLDRLLPVLGAMFGPQGQFAPEVLARQFGTGLATVFRRLACLPPRPGLPRFGLVICDAAGALTFRRPIDGFSPPRSGAGCPLWPLFDVLAQPDRPLRRLVEIAGRPPVRLLVHAVAGPRDPLRFDAPSLREATMLLTPAAAAGAAEAGFPTLAAGTTCRICPRAGCEARREPSIVGA